MLDHLLKGRIVDVIQRGHERLEGVTCDVEDRGRRTETTRGEGMERVRLCECEHGSQSPHHLENGLLGLLRAGKLLLTSLMNKDSRDRRRVGHSQFTAPGNSPRVVFHFHE